ncbi:helix-turn-helix domain-containing protein [Streptomyces caatingaensis]|uniref:helix-turn-helix domain-containing protein n=1 Tax=Streptomyces caatingaensis TaxID=1678637 RepID=UPI0006727545|nr:helix-turn-helix transcriptional regulator [Streptomyces caatingaensis]
MGSSQSASDFVAQRVQELRKRQGLSAKELAERCRLMGAPGMTGSVIANIESGRRDLNGRRRRQVTLEEWLILAQALHVAPIHLLVPVDDEQVRYELTPEPSQPTHGLQRENAGWVRGWIRGEAPLTFTDERIYRSEVPAEEWKSRERRQREGHEAYIKVWEALGAAGVEPEALTADAGGDQGEAEPNG